MSDLIIIRLHAEKPTDGVAFTSYLAGAGPVATTGLHIEVRDMSFQNPGGAGNVIGTAFYDPANPSSTIVQHLKPFPPPMLAAVATAVIRIDPAKLPPVYPEYVTSDLRLTVKRGTQIIVDRSLNYNVKVDSGAVVPPGHDPFDYANLGPVALYLSLPDPQIGLDPSHAFIDIPADGSPPSYDDLLNAIKKVYAKDPGGVFDIHSPPLTAAQARHIAHEIIWNRDLVPLPLPPHSLEQVYTTGSGAASDTERQTFESDLITYYTTNDTRAEVLAKYVFAISAALQCEQKTIDAPHAGFALPVLPGIVDASGKTAETSVIVSG